MSSQFFSQWKEELEEAIKEPLIHFITNFIWEKYDFKKTKKLIFLYIKMKEKLWTNDEQIMKKAHNRAVRVKWFYSLSWKWANMKDLAYYRWLKIAWKKILEATDWDQKKKEEILDWLKQNYNIWKIWFNDLELFKEIIPEYKDKKLPFFLGKLLFSKLKWDKIYFEKTPETWEFSKQELYNEKDFRFEYENISYEIKKYIIQILGILKK
jgi:hypothetical protein